MGRRGFREVLVSSSRGEERHSGPVVAVISAGRTIMVSVDWGQTVALSADSRDTTPKSAHR